MDLNEALIERERAAWRALSTDGETAAAFFADVLADEVLMLLPGGLVIDDREQAIDAMRGGPWASFELADERTLTLGPDSAIVAYQARIPQW